MDFDNDDNNDDNQESSSYSSTTRRSSGNNKNVNILGFSLPADTVNIATGILAAIGTIGTGLYIYDKYNQNKQQQELQKKQQEQSQVEELIKNLQLQDQNNQQQQQQQANTGAYINQEMLGNPNSNDYLKHINNELDDNQDNGNNNDIHHQQQQQQQGPMINMERYTQNENKPKQVSKPQIDTSIYQSSQAPDPTTYF